MQVPGFETSFLLVRTSRNRKRQPVGHHWWRALRQSGCTSDLQVSVVWWFGMTDNLPRKVVNMSWNEAALLRWRHETPLGRGRLISSLTRWANFANILYAKSNAKSNARWQKVHSWLRPWQIWPAWDMSQGLRIATTVSPAALKDGKWVVQIISNYPSSFHQAIIYSLLWWSCGTGPKSFDMFGASFTDICRKTYEKRSICRKSACKSARRQLTIG